MEGTDAERAVPMGDPLTTVASAGAEVEHAPSAPAGWYRQPDGSQRYWDGQFWDTHPPVPPPPPAPAPPPQAAVPAPQPTAAAIQNAQSALGAQTGLFWLTGLAALLLIVGGFGPWATALNFVSISGTHGDGWFAIGLGVFAIVMLWLHAKRGTRGPLIWVVLAGIGGAILGFVDRADIVNKGSGNLLGQNVQFLKPAWGIYMVIVASIGLAIGGGLLNGRARSARPAPPPPPPPIG